MKLGKYIVGGFCVYTRSVYINILYNIIYIFKKIYIEIIIVYYLKMTYLLIDDLGNIIGYNYFD